MPAQGISETPDTISVDPAISLFDVRPFKFQRYERQNAETHSLDTAEAGVVFLMSTGWIEDQNASDFAPRGLETWYPSGVRLTDERIWGDCVIGSGPLRASVVDFRPGNEPVWESYFLQTAAPTGAQDWLTLDSGAETRPRHNVDWLTTALKRIWSFQYLQAKWDGYQGRSVHTSTCFRAVAVTEILASLFSATDPSSAKPPFVAPLSSGGILFEVRNANRELHLAIERSDPEHYDVLKVSTTPSGDEIEEEATIHESNLYEVLSWIALAG